MSIDMNVSSTISMMSTTTTTIDFSTTTTINDASTTTVPPTTTMDPVTALTYDLTWHGVYIVSNLQNSQVILTL
jgi:hypothetical protein